MGIAMLGKNKDRPVMQMCTDYCDTVWRDPAGLIKNAKHTLKGVKFDTFVATGQSGSLALSLFARAFRKNLFVVRKEADHQSSHSSLKWIGQMGQRWVFLDDFVSSGSTKRKVVAGVQDAIDYMRNTGNGEFTTEFVGTYEYEHDRWTANGFWDNEDKWVNQANVMKPTPREEPKPEPTYGSITLPPIPAGAYDGLQVNGRLAMQGNAYVASLGAPVSVDALQVAPLPDLPGCGIAGCAMCRQPDPDRFGTIGVESLRMFR